MDMEEVKRRAAEARKRLGIPDSEEDVARSEKAIYLLMQSEAFHGLAGPQEPKTDPRRREAAVRQHSRTAGATPPMHESGPVRGFQETCEKVSVNARRETMPPGVSTSPEGVRYLGFTDSGWSRLRPEISAADIDLIRTKGLVVQPAGLVAAVLGRQAVDGVCKPAANVGIVLSPKQKFNFCAFQAYCLYKLLSRTEFYTMEGRRDAVLEGWRNGLAWLAAKVALGSDDAADRSSSEATAVMNRLEATWERCFLSAEVPENAATRMLMLALPEVVLGESNPYLGMMLFVRLMEMAIGSSTPTQSTSPSFFIDSGMYRPEDTEIPKGNQSPSSARDTAANAPHSNAFKASTPSSNVRAKPSSGRLSVQDVRAVTSELDNVGKEVYATLWFCYKERQPGLSDKEAAALAAAMSNKILMKPQYPDLTTKAVFVGDHEKESLLVVNPRLRDLARRYLVAKSALYSLMGHPDEAKWLAEAQSVGFVDDIMRTANQYDMPQSVDEILHLLAGAMPARSTDPEEPRVDAPAPNWGCCDCSNYSRFWHGCDIVDSLIWSAKPRRIRDPRHAPPWCPMPNGPRRQVR
jgi:hypothetical protein